MKTQCSQGVPLTKDGMLPDSGPGMHFKTYVSGHTSSLLYLYVKLQIIPGPVLFKALN